MRKLAMFGGAFAVAVLAFLYLPAGTWFWFAAGGFLAAGAVCWVGKLPQWERLRLLCFGCALGLLWSGGYTLWRSAPVSALAETTGTITGTAVDYSVETAYGCAVTAVVQTAGRKVRSTVYLREKSDLKPGDRFTVTARLEAADGDLYSRSEGIWLLAYARGDAAVTRCRSVPLRYAPKAAAHQLTAAIVQVFPADTAGFAMALAAGDRSGLSYNLKASLQRAGIYHTVAVSGMHLAILLGIFGCFVRRKKLRALVGIPLCLCFAALTGFSPSITRACIMQSLLLLAPVVRRESDSPTALGAAALLMLLSNPYCAANWGMQLSFLSVSGILLFTERIQTFLQKCTADRRERGALRLLLASVSTTLGAMALTVPLMAVYFGYICLLSPLVNLLTLWILPVCFGGSLLAGILGMLLPGVASAVAWVVSWPIRYVAWVAGAAARLPFAVAYTDSPYILLWLGLLYGLLVLSVLTKNRRPLAPACCGASALVVCLVLTVLAGSGAAVSVLDVGQGQCLVATDGGSAAVIDCGGSRRDLAGQTAADYLAARGIFQVKVLVLTHYDSDHVNGTEALLARMPVETVLLPDVADETGIRQELETAAAGAGSQIRYVTRDLLVSLGRGSLTVFAPVDSGSDNSASLSILTDLGDLQVLVTGDMDMDAESRLLRAERLPALDALVAGHHGSKYSTSAALLAATTPEAVLVSVGEGNAYGHPAAEALTRIAAAGAAVYRTDQCGTITLRER